VVAILRLELRAIAVVETVLGTTSAEWLRTGTFYSKNTCP
jgi:hypothetical protein